MRSGSQPAVDLAATPKGWVPVDYGDAQVSVPAKWKVAYRSPACASAIAPGELFVNPVPTTMSCMEIVQNKSKSDPWLLQGCGAAWRRAVNGVAVYGSTSGKAGPFTHRRSALRSTFKVRSESESWTHSPGRQGRSRKPRSSLPESDTSPRILAL